MMPDNAQLVSEGTFKMLMWTICGLSTAFLASRLIIRCGKKEKLTRSDSLLLLALPSLFAGSALLHSILSALFDHDDDSGADRNQPRQHATTAPRLTAAVELLWTTIYCVKASFLLQFKFHKPPYSLVSTSLTRYYWVAVAICMMAFVCTLAVPPVLCPSSHCRYLQGVSSTTRAWEISLVIIDIATDLAVVAIPVLLIRMANFSLSRAIINTVFKSLSVCIIAIAATRLAFLCDTRSPKADYTIAVFWLVIEAAIALIAASVSSYRVLVLDRLCERQPRQQSAEQKDGWELLHWWKS